MKTKTDYSIQNLRIDITVIIVNYRSWGHLRNCLSNLLDIPQDDFTLEVIVVDNCSNDGCLTEFSNEFPQIKFIENTINGGFSNGCNFGAEQAQGNYLLFLNPDALATKLALLTMLQLSSKHPNYGVISCRKMTKKGVPETEARLFPKFARLFGLFRSVDNWISKKKLEQRFNASKQLIFPDWVSGSVFFMSRGWFDKLGGWNEDYWLYLEDVDFCKRISDAGGKIALIRTAEIVHNHGGASRSNIKTAALTKVEVIISKHVYFQKHFKGIVKFLAQTLFVIVTFIIKLIFAIVGLVFFFVPKLKVNTFIFINLIKYYVSALAKFTWISKRSVNYL